MTAPTLAAHDRDLIAAIDRVTAELDAIDRAILILGAAARERRSRLYVMRAERAEIRDVRRAGADTRLMSEDVSRCGK